MLQQAAGASPPAPPLALTRRLAWLLLRRRLLPGSCRRPGPLPTCACGRRRPERVAAPAARRLAWRLAVRLLQLHGGLLQLQLR